MVMNKRKKKCFSPELKAILSFSLAIFALSIHLTAGEQGEYIDGWGTQTLVMALGLFGIFWVVRRQRVNCNWVLNIVCMFFSLFMVIGPVFAQTQSWDLLFVDGAQKVRAFVLWGGYSLVCKKSVLFARWLFGQLPEGLWRREARGKVEEWLFEKHSFWGVVLTIWVMALPWLLMFFPGTLEPDARGQIHMALGYDELTGHHPVVSTGLMGLAMRIGQTLFGSDNMGIFAYTFIQFMIQSCVFAYVIYVLGQLAAPMILRWCTIVFYCVFPLFPMWGYTVVKDTGYYISILLFVVTIVHLLCGQDGKAKWWQIVLLVFGTIGSCCFRKDGYMVVLITLFLGLILYKKYRKILVWGIVAGLIFTISVNGYMALNEIPKGALREALSIPLQQTGRYVWAHYDEMSPEEVEALQSVFKVEVEALGYLYAPELADPVKGSFIDNPTGEDLKTYFGVWWKQFLKHPGTYVQAFLNQTYGYFYPDKSISKVDEDIAVFVIWESNYFDLSFGIENEFGRIGLENYSRMVKQLPVVGMLYSVGMHSWMLIGCIVYLLGQKRWKELVMYLPGVCVLAISVLSPVNTCIRYMLPVIALLPVHLGWLMRGKEVTSNNNL